MMLSYEIDDIEYMLSKAFKILGSNQDEAIKEHLINHLVKDERFLKWFKENYLFNINVHFGDSPFLKDESGKYYIANRKISFNGPTWIPFWSRFKRKIMRFFK